MTRLAAFLAVLAAVACPAAGAPVPDGQGAPLPYFATQVGSRWTYQYPGADVTLVVTAAEKKDGTHVVAVGRVRDGGKVTPYETVEVSPRGLFRQESVAYLVTTDGGGQTTTTEKVVPDVPPVCLLRLPAKAGDRWEARLGGTRPATLTAAREEVVKVPAGRFMAVPVDLALETPPGRPALRARYWYAPGVGAVKWTTLDGGEIVLKAFSPGKK